MAKIEIGYSRDLVGWQSTTVPYSTTVEIVLPEPGMWWIHVRQTNDEGTEFSNWSNEVAYYLEPTEECILVINYDSVPELLE